MVRALEAKEADEMEAKAVESRGDANDAIGEQAGVYCFGTRCLHRFFALVGFAQRQQLGLAA